MTCNDNLNKIWQVQTIFYTIWHKPHKIQLYETFTCRVLLAPSKIPFFIIKDRNLPLLNPHISEPVARNGNLIKNMTGSSDSLKFLISYNILRLFPTEFYSLQKYHFFQPHLLLFQMFDLTLFQVFYSVTNIQDIILNRLPRFQLQSLVA